MVCRAGVWNSALHCTALHCYTDSFTAVSSPSPSSVRHNSRKGARSSCARLMETFRGKLDSFRALAAAGGRATRGKNDLSGVRGSERSAKSRGNQDTGKRTELECLGNPTLSFDQISQVSRTARFPLSSSSACRLYSSLAWVRSSCRSV